jgi:hypothetical protein
MATTTTTTTAAETTMMMKKKNRSHDHHQEEEDDDDVDDGPQLEDWIGAVIPESESSPSLAFLVYNKNKQQHKKENDKNERTLVFLWLCLMVGYFLHLCASDLILVIYVWIVSVDWSLNRTLFFPVYYEDEDDEEDDDDDEEDVVVSEPELVREQQQQQHKEVKENKDNHHKRKEHED